MTLGGAASERDYYRRLLDLSGCDDLEPLLDDALGLAVEITGAQVAYLELHDDAGEVPRFWRAYGLNAAGLDDVRESISRGILARALAVGETVETSSAVDDERFAGFRSVRARGIGGVLCVPIGRRSPLGALYLQRDAQRGAFSAEDRDRIELFARQLTSLADRLLLHRPAAAEGVDPTQAVRQRFRCPELVGRSQALAHLLQQAALVAPLDLDVLITGPSGTGKTVLASAIVANSKRAGQPFVVLNCAAIPEQLLESELYGAERGAHSTATRRMVGKVAAAEGGTLFLDEIGELPLAAQAKLLHLLQAREYHPLGATSSVRANVRILSATNVDLQQRVAARSFREDLFYRLQVLPIAMPGLAERRDDIPAIAQHICREVCARHGLRSISVAPHALVVCREAAWPGHVRQLAHALEAAVIRAHGEGADMVFEHHVFPSPAPASADAAVPRAPFHEATRQFQRRYLLETLDANDWNIALTARQLGLSRSYVYELIQTAGIARKSPA